VLTSLEEADISPGKLLPCRTLLKD